MLHVDLRILRRHYAAMLLRYVMLTLLCRDAITLRCCYSAAGAIADADAADTLLLPSYDYAAVYADAMTLRRRAAVDTLMRR